MNKELDFLHLRAAIEVDQSFEILKEKYKDIEVDMISWRSNPTCVCGKKVHDYFKELYSKEEEANFLESLFKNEEVQEKVKEIVKGKGPIVRNNSSLPQVPPEMMDYRGKIFVVGKTEEDWENFWKKIIEDKAAYRTFSLLDAGEYLKVYFL